MEENVNQYDVFISYRRDGGSHYARMLDLSFRLMGVKPFFDREEIKRGYFDKAILTHIERSKYFLFLLTPNSLDRCMDDSDDWVKRELLKALETKDERIVVVTPEDEVVWPSGLPQELARLTKIQCQCIDFESDAFVDDVRRVIRRCLPDVRTDSDRRAEEIARQKAERDFVAQALLFLANDGRLDSKELEQLNDEAKRYGINDERRDELLDEAESRYLKDKNDVQRRLGNRIKRFVTYALVAGAVLLVVSAIAWYNGYVHGRKNAECTSMKDDGLDMQNCEPKDYSCYENGVTGGVAVECDNQHSVGFSVAGGESISKHDDAAGSPGAVAACAPGAVVADAPRVVSVDNKSPGAIFAKRTKEDSRRELMSNPWNGILIFTIESDFRGILGREYKDTSYIMSWTSQDEDRVKRDAVTKKFIQLVDSVRAEPLALEKGGMRTDEIIRARPDLVIKLGEIRHAANESAKQLIRDGKHMEALSYYESVKTAFKYCAMSEFDRPDFSGDR